MSFNIITRHDGIASKYGQDYEVEKEDTLELIQGVNSIYTDEELSQKLDSLEDGKSFDLFAYGSYTQTTVTRVN